MTCFSLARRALVATLFIAALPATAADGWRIVQSIDGSVSSLSADGRAATGWMMDTFEAFRWTQREGLVRLGRGTLVPLGHRSGTPRISADGSVVSATILTDDGKRSAAGRWTAASGWTVLGPLPAGAAPLGGEDSSAFGMSGDGQVVTGLYWRNTFTAGPMAWSAPTGMVDLGSERRSSRVDGASADGRVLGGWDEHPQYGNRRAAVWVDGVRTIIEDSDWPSEVSAVSADGTQAVGYSGNPADFQTYATRWSWNGGGWTKTLLGVVTKPDATGYASATGVSGDGSIIVGLARPDNASPKSIGFVWTPDDGFVNAAHMLRAAGVHLNPLQQVVRVGAVSADGRTIAVGTQGVQAPYTTRTLIVRRGAD